MVSISARACSTETPGRRRANARTNPAVRDATAGKLTGAHICALAAQNSGKAKPGGMTPTTVYVSAFNMR
jgi:hypothetical protein